MAQNRWYDFLFPRRPSLASNSELINAGVIHETSGQPGSSPPPASPAGSSSGIVTGGVRHHGVIDEEFGVSGTENYGGTIKHDDANPDWDNFERAVKICDKMRRTDAQLRAMSQVIKLPLLGATWEAMPQDNGDATDKQIADFINRALFDDDAMDDSWGFTLAHILTHLEYGFSVLETIWRVADDGSFRLKRMAPRLAKTIKYWYVDRAGKLLAVVQYAPIAETKLENLEQASPTAPPTLVTAYAHYQYLTIPSDYLVVFTHDREGDQYEGTSMFRTVYRNFFFKDQAYRLEGVRLDRYGVGIPVAEIQPNHTLTAGDLDALGEVLRKVRANERAFLIAPPSVRYKLLPEGSTSSSGTSGAVGWIEHHDQQIARNILAGFLTMGTDPHGTLGFGSRLTDLFTSNLRGIAMGVAGELKRQVVRRLCDYNFDMTGRQYPSIVVKDLDLSHIDSLVETLAQLTGTIITPDDDTEDLLRKMLKLPPLPPDLSRAAAKAAQQPPPGIDPATGLPLDPNAPGGEQGVKHEAAPGQALPITGVEHDGIAPEAEGGVVHEL